LIEANANVNMIDATVGTALIDAIPDGRIDIVNALLAAKADVNESRSGLTALMVASANGNLEIVRALLNAKADVNAKCGLQSFESRSGDTALMKASRDGYVDVCEHCSMPKPM